MLMQRVNDEYSKYGDPHILENIMSTQPSTALYQRILQRWFHIDAAETNNVDDAVLETLIHSEIRKMVEQRDANERMLKKKNLKNMIEFQWEWIHQEMVDKEIVSDVRHQLALREDKSPPHWQKSDWKVKIH